MAIFRWSVAYVQMSSSARYAVSRLIYRNGYMKTCRRISLPTRITGKLKRPDSNIDHRRVPNLETWFQRQNKALPVTDKYSDYQPGDIVSWRLDNGLAHIGVVSLNVTPEGVPLVVHNIGAGAQEEDVLFNWKVTGHFRYFSH